MLLHPLSSGPHVFVLHIPARFRTDLGVVAAAKDLYQKSGWKFLTRGMVNNVIAVSLPIATTIWLADVFERIM